MTSRSLVRFFIITALLALPGAIAAQPTGPPTIWMLAPSNGSTRHALNPRIYMEYGAGGGCLDPGDGSCDPDPGTLVVKINGGDNIAQFKGSPNPGWTIGALSAYNGTDVTGVDDFNGTYGQSVSNTLYAKICNDYGCTEETITVYIDLAGPPIVTLDGHSPNVHDLGACAAIPVAPGAAFACDALVISHGIPGYVSLDVLRSVAVVYSSRSALAEITVPASVEMIWDAGAEKVEAELAGYSSTYWEGTDWDGTSDSVTRRVVLSRPEDTDTGGYVGRAAETFLTGAHTAAGLYEDTTATTLPFYFERNGLTTEIARGWGIAGLSRIYGIDGHDPGASAPTGDVLLVQGGGGVAFYDYLSTGGDTIAYERPAGVFAMLRGSDPSGDWVLTAMDGTLQYYSWVTSLGYARLDSIVSPEGSTAIAYRSGTSGSPSTITDPKGKQIAFGYDTGTGVGKLEEICAPAGANERCTYLYYGSSGGHTVVDSIVDPDGGKTVFGYSGGPHWSAITSITPRALGTYTVVYGSQVSRPVGVVQPTSSDTVHYLAPQLAGAAFEGGSSGNPAASAAGDPAWGSVSAPLGPATSFAADAFGNTTWTKNAEGTVSGVTRDEEGQPVTGTHDGQDLMHWTYNDVGAVTMARMEGGDTTTIAYAGACGSEDGYPCLPTQRVTTNTPLDPDTTVVYYGSDVLVDSIYRSERPYLSQKGGGIGVSTRYWYGANARVDSVLHLGEDVWRAEYESTWGNLETGIGLPVWTDCNPTCTTVRDTTTYTHDVIGLVVSTQRGAAGRKVTVFRDLIGRDTMVVDSAEGGGSAITTKTRFDDGARTVTVIDGNGAEFESLFDARGRAIRRTDPAGARDTFAFDAIDRVTSWTTRRDQTITYTYDGLGRLTRKVGDGDTTAYGYHATLGTLDTLISPSASIYREHNQFGWLTEEKTIVNSVTRTVTYGHTLGGMLDSLTDPWSGVYTFGWNTGNRARTITNPFAESFGVRYNEDGLLTQVDFPTGTDNFTYDPSRRVQTAGLGGEVEYAWDPVTKLMAGIQFWETQLFEYDGYGRLSYEDVDTPCCGPGEESYAYDAAGNKTGTGYSYDVTNAVRGRPTISGDSYAPGDSLVYDATGNPIWWKNKDSGQYDSLTWNAENQLVRLRRYSSGGSLQLDVTYQYDGFGRRVRQSGTGVDDRLYVWNGWELLAETDLSGNATRRYTHHPEGIDFPLAMREGSTTHYLHRDGQGNVYTVTNTSGTRRSLYTYLAWGDRYNSSTEHVESPFTYKAREEDRETGLVYMRHRYYSPRLERFLNEDPIGVLGGMNVYGFASINPVNVGDPFGLSPCYTWYCPLPPIITYGNALGAIQNWSGYALIGDQFDGWSGSNFTPVTVPGLDASGAGGAGSGGAAVGATGTGDSEDSQDGSGAAGGTDELNSCLGGSMAIGALVGGGTGAIRGVARGFARNVVLSLGAARVGATVGAVSTFEVGGVGAAPGAVLAGLGTFASLTLRDAVVGGVQGAVTGGLALLTTATAPGRCVRTAH